MDCPRPVREGNVRRRRRPAAWLLGFFAIALLLSSGAAGCGAKSPPAADRLPALIFDQSVGSDLRTLTTATWDQFLSVFQARANCFGDVRVQAAYQLGNRGGYDPDTATVTVQVPGTPAKLQSALVHEWAHHVEYQCPGHKALREAFLAAQGLSADTPWRPAESSPALSAGDWADIPSEQCAEAAVELVLGRRALPTTAPVTREAVQVLKAWATGQFN
jgi:hypothetical protein